MKLTFKEACEAVADLFEAVTETAISDTPIDGLGKSDTLLTDAVQAKADAIYRDGQWRQSSLTESRGWALARQLESDRARLIEALNYWMPDESLVDQAHSEKWNEHVALLKELTDRSI